MRLQGARVFVLFSTLFLLWGCAGEGSSNSAPPAITLNVFAAASLTDTFTEIGETFSTANPGVEIVFNFAGSNQLATQIAAGAPADLFASANPAQMEAVIASGEILSSTQQTFAQNQLVVITPADNPAGISTLHDLARPTVKLIFAAAEVPVGRYTLTFLDKAAADPQFGTEYSEAVLANVVSQEANVRAVLTKIMLGEGDAGIVYTSDVGAATEAITQIEIPADLNTVASYPIAPLVGSEHGVMAQQFIDYLLSSTGQQVLGRYGFVPVSPASD